MAIENKDLATIKKPNQVEYITKEQLIERIKEIKKCRQDIVYFCENYYRIQSLDKGLHVVKLYDVQKDLLRFMVDNNRIIVLSPRQAGKSSTYCMYTLWLTCFHPDKKVLMLAQKENTALELLDRIKTGYEYLPSWLKPGCGEFNKSSIEFTNRSSIKGMASGSDSARGTSANVLILDEFAFLNKSVSDKLFTSVYPVVSSSKNGKVIVVSTPNGKHNLYYDLWKKANNKDDPDNIDGWKPFRMDWWQIPGRDEQWKQAQIAAIGKTRFAQEFNNEFLDDTTTTKLIPDEIADRYRVQMTEFKIKNINQGKTLSVTSKDGKKTYPFTMYHDFNPKRTYLASGDVAEGVKKDASTLYIWDVTDTSNVKMCCKFSSNEVSILEFAYIADQILHLYANPFFACESNGISLGFIEQLRVTYGYENIVKMNKNNGYGIDSHYVLKTKACLWCRDMMTTIGFGFELYDAELIEEFSTFVKKDTVMHTVYQALKNSHDDHLMAFVWMCWILAPENVDKYFNVVDTFKSSTEQIFPKTLLPYYEYSPTEIAAISENFQVKAFQFYKTMNNNEFLLEHEKKVEERKNLVVSCQPDGESVEENIDKIEKKRVLNQNEVVRLMKHYNGGAAPAPKKQKLPYDRDMLNVVWSSYDQPQGGITTLFGFDDDDDGPEW